MIKNFKWLLLVSLSFVACNNDDETAVVEPPVVIVPGTANFSKYVALGDSFAAGYGDNALYKKGQETSYPNILAQQFALAGGGVFATPFMTDDNIGGFSIGGNQVPQFQARLYFDGAAPAKVAGVSGTAITARLTGPFNNMGLPGAKSFHLGYSGYAAANPYFGRFASNPAATVLGDALAQNPSFFSLWIGGNDVLGYATNGGVPTSQDAVLGNDITPPATFNAVYNGLAASLSAGGRKGVVANLPYINTLPYFTTVPFNPLTTSVLGGGNVAIGEATIQALNAQLYGPLKSALTYIQSLGAPGTAGVATRINVLSATTGNSLLIKDETLVDLAPYLKAVLEPSLGVAKATLFGQVFGQARQATSADFVLLTTKAVIASPTGYPAPLDKFGITFPLEDKHMLISSEIAEIKTAVDAYNVTIKNAADANGLAFVDTKVVMDKLVNGGIPYEGYILKSDFVFGGAFSLDGVHPTARGYAMIANLFSAAINVKYGSNLPMVKLTNYPILRPKSF